MIVQGGFIPHICHGHTDGVRGEKKLSCGEISNFCTWNMWRKLKFLHKWINFKFLHMTDVEKSEISFVVCTIYGILLHFTLFCCQICFFLAIYAVLSHYRFFRFTHYYVEKNLAKNSARGEKMTNMRYGCDRQPQTLLKSTTQWGSTKALFRSEDILIKDIFSETWSHKF